MERIDDQKPGFKTLATQVLSWITYSERQLTIAELQHALAVEFGESELDETNLPEPDDMISACAGLVTVDQESNVIRLVHYTTQEYFERIRLSWAPDAQTEITRTCLTYLSFNAFQSGPCMNDQDFEARLQQNVLLDYAARYWGCHARAASNDDVKQFVLDTLNGILKLDYVTQVMMASDNDYDDYSQIFPKQVTAIHLAAYFGLEEVIMELLNGGHLPDLKDSNGCTPLSWAVEYGHEAVVKLLVERDDVEVNSENDDGDTLLSQAAENGNETMVLLLLDRGADPNLQGRNRTTALQAAAARGHETIVRLLLNEGADINAQGGHFSNALQAAAAGEGDENIIRLLLNEGADINAQGGIYGNALQAAAAGEGGENIIRLLLNEGADINAQGGVYGNALQAAAARKGDENIIRLLLSEGADIDAQGEGYKFALEEAKQFGRHTMIQFLLENAEEDPMGTL